MTATRSLNVTQDGRARFSTVLLIHGTGASSRSWDSLVPMLTDRHRVVRPDLPGHGRSPESAAPQHSISELASAVALELDQLGIEEAAVVGHSTGGAVGVALAEQRPSLVTSLVLIGTGPSADAYIAPAVAVNAADWPHLTDDQIRTAMAPAFSRPGYDPPQSVVDDVRAVSFHTFAATTQASLGYLQKQSLPDRLASLEVPLMVISGAEDRRWSPSSAANYRTVPGAIVETLSEIGHSPMMENPTATAALLRPFLAAAPQNTTPRGANATH